VTKKRANQGLSRQNHSGKARTSNHRAQLALQTADKCGIELARPYCNAHLGSHSPGGRHARANVFESKFGAKTADARTAGRRTTSGLLLRDVPL
jgi:hypothetical protein